MKKIILTLALVFTLTLCAGIFTACGDDTVYFVTFELNYENAPAIEDESNIVNVKSGNKVTVPELPERVGYDIVGWYLDAECTQAFDLGTKITEDTTLYAKWDLNSGYARITFDLSEKNVPNQELVVKKGTAVTEPEVIVPGWECLNWYKDEAKTDKYIWGLVVNESMTLYGEWAQQFTFEAEYCANIKDLKGAGFSGGTSGLAMIEKDTKNKGASNGYYVNYMYKTGLYLQFTIESDVAVSNASMYVRLSTEIIDIDLTSSKFAVTVNDVPFDYPEISMDPVGEGTAGEKADFKDWIIASGNLSLKKGENVIRLEIVDATPQVGTMEAEAPLIDCIKITTDANLTWTKDCDKSNVAG